ncbi:MAG: YbaK/EbsC family protein, partial [Candidatus Bathyarchaeia archaeon]
MPNHTSPIENLENYLRQNRVEARIIKFKNPTSTVEEAEKALGVNKEQIIKTIIFTTEKGLPIAAIVTGDQRVNEQKLIEVLGAQRVKIARLSAVKSITGYDVGGVPPVGHSQKTRITYLIDRKVMTFDKV